MDKLYSKKGILFFDFLNIRVVMFFLLLGFIFISIYLLNCYYPLFADDFPFSMIYGTSTRIKSFSDLLNSQYLFYIDHSGRTVEHTIAQILLWINTPWRDFLHSIAYVFLIFVVYKIANFTLQKYNYILLILIFLSVWFFQVDFSTTVLNITSGAVYMWGTFINLIFILFYCQYYYSTINEDSVLKAFVFFVFGVVAGWTQENMAPCMIFIAVAILYLKQKSIKGLPRWTILGIIGAMIGCALLIFAPGNYIRINTDPSAAVAKANPLLNGIYNVVGGYLDHGIIITLVYLIVLTIYFLMGKNENKMAHLKLSILFFSTSLLALGIMIFSPIFPPRAWFGIIMLMITAIAILYANIEFRLRSVKYCNILILIIGIVLYMFQYNKALLDLKEINNVVERREKFIKEQKNSGIYQIVLSQKIMPRSNFTSISDPLADPTHWLYLIMVDYYGVNSVEFVQSRKNTN